MNAQHTADNVLIDLHTESQRDLLSNARTTPAGITPFHCHDGFDEFSVGALRARPAAAPRRKQHAVLSFAQHTLEMQQSGRLQNDGGTKDTCRAHEQCAQAGDDPICSTQVGSTLAPAIEDQQLMPDQHGFGDYGTESTRPCQSGQSDDQMNEYDSEVTHPGNRINTSGNPYSSHFGNSPWTGMPKAEKAGSGTTGWLYTIQPLPGNDTPGLCRYSMP